MDAANIWGYTFSDQSCNMIQFSSSIVSFCQCLICSVPTVHHHHYQYLQEILYIFSIQNIYILDIQIYILYIQISKFISQIDCYICIVLQDLRIVWMSARNGPTKRKLRGTDTQERYLSRGQFYKELIRGYVNFVTSFTSLYTLVTIQSWIPSSLCTSLDKQMKWKGGGFIF